MKKRILIIALIISILIFSMLIVGKMQIKEKEIAKNDEDEIIEESKEPVEWHANYIWDETRTDNTWMCFRKKVTLDQDYKKVIAQIAADSKYWLYINDEMVVREGALKRGETKNSIYYDEIDLTNYLHKGENTIAVLVWYWGGESYSHVSCGQGAMLFQAKLGDTYLISDETWKTKKHEAYGQDPLRPNNRLIEYNVYYDGAKAQEDWYKSNFDDSTWENAKILGFAGAEPWGEMIERNIPQFKNYEIAEYENMADFAEYTTTETETLEMIIPYNAQFTPYLKIEAPEGKKITIKTDQYSDINGDSVRCTYFTKEGVQEFQSLAWMNGEKVYYEISEGVKIISLGYRETGYDSEMTGSFKSDDEFFNKLWEMASRTLYVNMRDSYMDCPNRERTQWFGDMNEEMLQAMYALDTNAYFLYEKGVKTVLGWEEQNALLTVVPNSLEAMHLPMQMLAGISGFYDYYRYTGQKDFLVEVYPYVKNYLNLWAVGEDGLVYCTSNYYLWEWGDSASDVDYDALENAFYYMAMKNMCQMADVLGYQEDKTEFEARLQNLQTSYNNNLWTEDGYKTETAKYIDERTNAVAVISGLADTDKYDVIKNILVGNYQSSAYMERYILEALCKMGYTEEAQNRIKERYDEMVNGENACSTLWESWVYEAGTKNHAWSGGPLLIMSKYFAGIEPLKSGYDEISIKPQFGNLSEISANVTTVKGDIELKTEKAEDCVIMKITVPTRTRLAIPKCGENPEITINDKTVYKKGKAKRNKFAEYESEDNEYFYFFVENGEYEIQVTNVK